jgi:hypothetical protein
MRLEDIAPGHFLAGSVRLQTSEDLEQLLTRVRTGLYSAVSSGAVVIVQ